MSDIFKKIRRVFIVDESPNPHKTPSSAPVEQPQRNEMPQASLPDSKVDPMAADRFVQVLWDAIRRNNKQGYDYYEFQASLRSLAEIHLDEPMRYKSALAVARPLGAQPEQLIQSARHYLQLLEQERQKFDEAARRQFQQQVEGQKQQVVDIDKQIAQKAQEIDRLTQQIEYLRKEIEQLKTKKGQLADSMSDTEEKIRTTAAAFLNALQHVQATIQHDIEAMQRYFR